MNAIKSILLLIFEQSAYPFTIIICEKNKQLTIQIIKLAFKELS